MDTDVVVIVIDALRADRVGALGGRDLTPQIDEFATDATGFASAFSAVGCSTDPAVTSIQTGKYPLSHGIINHGSDVTDAEKSAVEAVTQLPEVLSEAGYRTAKLGRPLGRWHRNGFDTYPSLEEGRTPFDSEKPNRQDSSQSDGPGIQAKFSELLERDQPVYGFVHLLDTHKPYDADPELVESCLERFDYVNESAASVNDRFPDGTDPFPGFIDDRWTESEYGMGTAVVSAHYDATVIEADRRVGQFLDTLRKTGAYDDTFVAILADHGESLTEHGIYYSHNGLYDQTMRVPLFIKPPGNSSGTSDELVQITDVAPTVLSYIGRSDEMSTDGESLRPLIESDGSIDREFILAEESYNQRRRAIRTHGEKAIYLVDGDTTCRACNVEHAPAAELYDLLRDENEQENIVDENRERFVTLRDRAERAVAALPSGSERRPTQQPVEYDDESEIYQRLRDLGYR